jgi:hypothetical protein
MFSEFRRMQIVFPTYGSGKQLQHRRTAILRLEAALAAVPRRCSSFLFVHSLSGTKCTLLAVHSVLPKLDISQSQEYGTPGSLVDIHFSPELAKPIQDIYFRYARILGFGDYVCGILGGPWHRCSMILAPNCQWACIWECMHAHVRRLIQIEGEVHVDGLRVECGQIDNSMWIRSSTSLTPCEPWLTGPSY